MLCRQVPIVPVASHSPASPFAGFAPMPTARSTADASMS